MGTMSNEDITYNSAFFSMYLRKVDGTDDSFVRYFHEVGAIG